MNTHASKLSAILVAVLSLAGLCLFTLYVSTGAQWPSQINEVRLNKVRFNKVRSSPAEMQPVSFRGAQNRGAQAQNEAWSTPEQNEAQSTLDVAQLEREARRRWAAANPAAARIAPKPGSYAEVAHLVQRSNWNALKPEHRKMVRRIMLSARAGQVGVMPCFAPATNPKVVQAFEGIASVLKYNSGTFWTTTASGSHAVGAPVRLRWSVVPDGTALPTSQGEPTENSNLKARLTAIYGNEDTWRALIRQVFARWSEVSGITYVEEAADDGVTVNSTNSGVIGVRGDVRIGGHFIDDTSGILAYNFFPNVGDMIIDTSDMLTSGFFLDTSSNSLGLRNVLSHEHGHGLAFAHVCPVNETKLMEPFVSDNFDGPQIDDIQNAQRGYGDPLEENDSQAGGTNLGTLFNGTVTRSTVSLDGSSDQDFYRFAISSSKNITATLTPAGGSYLDGTQDPNTGACSAGTTFNAGAQRDLQLAVLDNAGGVVAQVNATGAGSSETLSSTLLTSTAGPFTIRVSGDAVDKLQLYTLQFTLADAGPAPDFALNGSVTVNDSTGNGNNDGRPDPGETSLGLVIPLQNVGTLGATNVQSTLVSLTSGVTVTQANAAYPNIAVNATQSNTTQPVISIAAGFLCGTTISLRLDVQSNEGSDAVYFSLTTGTVVETPFNYTTPSVPIPDGTGDNVAGSPALVNLTVSGSGTIADLNVGLDNLTHTYVGDLVITLTSPQGTSVVLVNRMGNGNTAGPNFSSTVLDDEAANAIQTAANASAPFTGSYRPANALSAFDGQNANGTWTLKIQDFWNQDTGTLNAFSLRISTLTCGLAGPSATPTPTATPTATPIPNTAPTISNITDHTTSEDTPISAIAFTIGDNQTAVSGLTVNASSSNTTLVPNANIMLGGSSANRTLTITPAPSQSGTTTITVAVSDGSLTASDSFVLTVLPAPQEPMISDIANRSTPQGVSTGPINFVIDGGTSTGSLTLSGTSSNTTLVPNANIVFGGSGSNRTVTVTPASGQSGTTTITVTLSDGSGGSVSDTFVLTVVAAPTIASFNPTSGPVGTSVTITGTNLSNTSAVKFNATNASFTQTSATQLQAMVPSGATTGKISVTTPGGTATSSTDFTVTSGTPIPTYSISGRIADAQGFAINGVSVSRGGSTPVLTNGAGYYTLTGVPAGTYTLTPTKSNYTFTPVSRSVTVNTSNIGGQNFIGKTGISLSGRISTSTSLAIAGVTVSRGAGFPTATTNSAGYYTFIGVQPGSYTVTPTKAGYRFVPAFKTVTAGTTDISGQNFIGATGYNLAGRIANSSGIGQPNISVRRTGSNIAAVTNSAGYYTFIDVPNGTYTVTPGGTGLSFTPELRTVTINGADVSGHNFTVAPGYNIIGRITTSAGAAIPNVTVSRTGSTRTVLTNSSGYFVFSGVANGTYTVTPVLNGYTFTPSSKTVTVNGADAQGQNFIGVQ